MNQYADTFYQWVVANLKATPGLLAAMGSPIVFGGVGYAPSRQGVHIESVEALPDDAITISITARIRILHRGPIATAISAVNAVTSSLRKKPGDVLACAVQPSGVPYSLRILSMSSDAATPTKPDVGADYHESIVVLTAKLVAAA